MNIGNILSVLFPKYIGDFKIPKLQHCAFFSAEEWNMYSYGSWGNLTTGQHLTLTFEWQLPVHFTQVTGQKCSITFLAYLRHDL